MKKNLLKKKKYSRNYTDHYRVAIFGSARINKQDPRYKMIYMLAKKIAQEGIDIVTGGGPGLMEAANKGHKEGRNGTRAKSFGLNIALPREQSANKHLDIKKEFHLFTDRLDEFMALSNCVVVAPGGIGTTLELFYTWQLTQVHHIDDTPIILFGEMWIELLKWIENHPLKRGFMNRSDLHNIFVARNVDDVLTIIKTFHHQYKELGSHKCDYIKKYHKHLDMKVI